MSYLDDYGVGVERRHRMIKISLLTLLGLLVLAGILWFRFRNFREDQAVDRFFAALRNKDYQGAYVFWGCTVDHPCRDYSFEKFMEDWGPKSPHADLAAMQITETKSCSGGIIKFVKFPNDQVELWVDRSTKYIGFAPWPVCNPRMQVDVGGK
jgi:hypothetical protein